MFCFTIYNFFFRKYVLLWSIVIIIWMLVISILIIVSSFLFWKAQVIKSIGVFLVASVEEAASRTECTKGGAEDEEDEEDYYPPYHAFAYAIKY